MSLAYVLVLVCSCENNKISIPGRDASRHLYCTFSAVCYVSDPRPSSSQCRLILATIQSCGLGKVLYNALSELILLFLVYKLNKNEVLYRVEVSLDGRNKCVSTFVNDASLYKTINDQATLMAEIQGEPGVCTNYDALGTLEGTCAIGYHDEIAAAEARIDIADLEVTSDGFDMDLMMTRGSDPAERRSPPGADHLAVKEAEEESTQVAGRHAVIATTEEEGDLQDPVVFYPWTKGARLGGVALADSYSISTLLKTASSMMSKTLNVIMIFMCMYVKIASMVAGV